MTQASGQSEKQPVSPQGVARHDPRINTAPESFDAARDLPAGFMEFYLPLHRQFTSRQQDLAARREVTLAQSHAGVLPDHLPASEATMGEWHIELPAWCQDQRNQMTGPADDGELVVKMLNSGAPGVMLDVEDSMVNAWPNLVQGVQNIVEAMRGSLTYYDRKRERTVAIQESGTVIWNRARGLHLNQGGVIRGELTSASLFDLALIAFQAEPDEIKHPLSFYIPKTESADEALWWRDVFQAIARARGWLKDYIKCMALVEAHPMAYQMEEFIYNLRDHLLGLNLGRWDYMASLIHFNLEDPRWVLPDRNTIPHDVRFFQHLRELIPEICHKRGIFAIGGMTALFPDRGNPELNDRALKALAEDKKNEASSLMDGAWTGHPDQNQIAVDQFPSPNQVGRRRPAAERYPDLRPVPEGVGKRTVAGTRAAVRTVIRYRNGVLSGKGASLLDGYMEDLATDRIYRLMIAQRVKHSAETPILDDRGGPISHTPELVTQLFDEELGRILSELPPNADETTRGTYRKAREQSEAMITSRQFNPV